MRIVTKAVIDRQLNLRMVYTPSALRFVGVRMVHNTTVSVLVSAAILAASVAPTTQSTSPQHQSVRAGAATIQVVVKGAGEPIVFIPSRGRGAADFDDLANRLGRAGYRTIQPEPRGVAGSTGPLVSVTYHDFANDIAATIRAVARPPVTVIGHAFGGRIARTLAADHPNLVKQLILIAAPGTIPRAASIADVTDRFWETPLSPRDQLAAIQQTFFAAGNDARAWKDGWYFDVARAQRASDARTPVQEWWSGGTVPILILQGKDDLIAVPENARKLKADFPKRVTLIEIEHAGHAMLPEQPDRVADAVLAYLRGR